jgi:hypothetical protein
MNYSSAIWWRHLPAACNNFFEAGVSGNTTHNSDRHSVGQLGRHCLLHYMSHGCHHAMWWEAMYGIEKEEDVL